MYKLSTTISEWFNASLLGRDKSLHLWKQEFLCRQETNQKSCDCFSQSQLGFNGLFKKHLSKKVGIVCLFLCENKLHSNSSFSLKSLDYQQCQVCFDFVEKWLAG